MEDIKIALDKIRNMSSDIQNCKRLQKGILELYEINQHYCVEQETENMNLVNQIMFGDGFKQHASAQIQKLVTYYQHTQTSNCSPLLTETPHDFFTRQFQVIDVSQLNTIVNILCDNMTLCEIGTAFAVGLTFLYLQKYKVIEDQFIMQIWQYSVWVDIQEDIQLGVNPNSIPRMDLLAFCKQMEDVIQDLKQELFNKNLQPYLSSHIEVFIDFTKILDQSETDAEGRKIDSVQSILINWVNNEVQGSRNIRMTKEINQNIAYWQWDIQRKVQLKISDELLFSTQYDDYDDDQCSLNQISELNCEFTNLLLGNNLSLKNNKQDNNDNAKNNNNNANFNNNNTINEEQLFIDSNRKNSKDNNQNLNNSEVNKKDSINQNEINLSQPYTNRSCNLTAQKKQLIKNIVFMSAAAFCQQLTEIEKDLELEFTFDKEYNITAVSNLNKNLVKIMQYDDIITDYHTEILNHFEKEQREEIGSLLEFNIMKLQIGEILQSDLKIIKNNDLLQKSQTN